MRGTTLLVLAVVVVIGAAAFFLLRAPAPQPSAAPPTAAASKPAPTSGSLMAAGQVPTSPRPTPQEEVFKGRPGEGDGTDPELNRLKNRVDDAAWQPVTVEALLGLRWPQDIGRKRMAQWTPADHAQIDPFSWTLEAFQGAHQRLDHARSRAPGRGRQEPRHDLGDPPGHESRDAAGRELEGVVGA